MKDEKVTRAKLYTFAEMKNAVAQTVAEMAAASAHDDDFDDPVQVFVTELAVGAKIVAKLDERHKKGEL